MPKIPYRELAAWSLAAGAVTCTFVLGHRARQRAHYIQWVERELRTVRPVASDHAAKTQALESCEREVPMCRRTLASLASAGTRSFAAESDAGSARVVVGAKDSHWTVMVWPADPLASASVTRGHGLPVKAANTAGGMLEATLASEGHDGGSGDIDVHVSVTSSGDAGAPRDIVVHVPDIR